MVSLVRARKRRCRCLLSPRVSRDTSLHLFKRQEGKPRFLNSWSKMGGALRLRQRCHSRPHLATDGFKEAVDHPLRGSADQRPPQPHDAAIGFAIRREAQDGVVAIVGEADLGGALSEAEHALALPRECVTLGGMYVTQREIAGVGWMDDAETRLDPQIEGVRAGPFDELA